MRGKKQATLHHPKLRLVYEDDNLIVVEKQRGLLTVPVNQFSKEMTAIAILRAYVRRQHPRNNIFVVHRLDRETSGLLVFARTQALQEYMRTYWRQLVTQRTYVAVAEGIMPKEEGTITTWLTEDKRNAVVYSSPVDDGGDIAITHYKVLKTNQILNLKSQISNSAYSLVELHLDTGRTNQIRVHLASVGCPVLGDRKYGHGNYELPNSNQKSHIAIPDRLCLHARVLEFINPVTEQTLHFETPIPREFLHIFH
jgi:23S rRNA pseudouridine1911/1915/1917 synthase